MHGWGRFRSRQPRQSKNYNDFNNNNNQDMWDRGKQQGVGLSLGQGKKVL